MASPLKLPMRALVTGSTGGIGRAIATRLAGDGFEVLLHYRRNEEKAMELQDTIRNTGGQASVIQFDVTDGDAVRKRLESVGNEAPVISVLVNNAGVARDASFPTMTEDDWTQVTRTTLDGFFHVTQPLVMPMVRQRWGRIINISSVSGVVGNRGQVNYAAAKAGLIGATKSLSKELAKRKITVNAIAPGLIDTDMIADVPLDLALKGVPARRVGTPDEVASAVSYLVSDDAAYITGAVLNMNGGMA